MTMKRVLCALFTVLCLWGCGAQTESETTAQEMVPAQRSGIAFESGSAWRTRDTVQQPMDTMELWLQVSQVKEGGEVLLTTYGNGTPYVELVLSEKGSPVLRQGLTSEQALEYSFKAVDVRSEQLAHLAIVRDREAGKLLCYVNGECMDTITANHMSDVLPVRPLCVGSDHTASNQRYFGGKISSVAVFAGSRSAQQIKADMVKPEGEDLLYYYELGEAAATAADLSGNSRELVKSVRWFSEKEPVRDYAYAFAVIGDTQTVAINNPDQYHLITDYILENVQARNIRFVMGLGDITDTSSEKEWETAMQAYHTLDGVVPYSLARGNDSHDSVVTFQKYVSYEQYGDKASGTMEQDMRNAYYCFAVGSVQYMVLVLDCAPTDAMLDWANQVVAAHPERNVIVTTHMYLYRDGTTLDDGDPYKIETNNGVNIWEKFLRRHENIVLVLCGHDPTSQVVKSQLVGDHGNIVTQMMLDPQAVDLTDGSTGLVAMFYFSEDGKQVTMEYYSPIKGQYFLTENQFSFELDVVE
jgi:hypothetical protein